MEEKEIKGLIAQYGSPLYIFDEAGFKENFNHLCESFRKVYPNYYPGYSFKTNYTPYICNVVKDLGGYAEVVSDMELEIAHRVGFADDRIIYNGPMKGPGMERHLLSGGIINIDNPAEAKRIVELAGRHPEKQFKVGLRINTDIGAGFVSRFGVQIDTEDFKEIDSLIKSCDNLRLCGLHLHVSRARYLSAWKNRIVNILKAADEIIDGVPDYIDIGSGMFADMELSLKQQFTIDVPSYDDYAATVAGAMAAHYSGASRQPILFSEPGTTVVSRYLALITQVTAVKKLKEKNIAVLDCDIHMAGETCQMMKVPYTLYRSGEGASSCAPVDLSGCTCLEQDILYKDFPEPVRVGDIIEFRNIGGYSVVYKPPFIQPCCAMIVQSPEGVRVIKRAEIVDDILSTFSFSF